MLTFSQLRELQKRELETPELTPLPQNFYEELIAFLKHKSDESLKSQNLLAIKEFESIKKIAKNIIMKRREKIFLYLVHHNERLNLKHLTEEEKEFVDKVLNAESETIEKIERIFKISEESSEKKEFKKIRILSDIEAYKGLDNNIYGPFKVGDEVNLPLSEAEWLLKNKLAELIQ